MNAHKQDVWVYGVIRAGAALEELERRSDELPGVWVVEAGDLAAIVGDRPENGAKATRNQTIAHARVLEAAVLDAAVVPFRFGIIVPSDEEVGTDLLEAQHDELAELLRRVDGRVQMTLKVTYGEDVVLREIVQSDPRIAQLRDAVGQSPQEATRDVRAQLGELISNAVELRRQRDSAEILERLKPVSVAAVVEGLETEFMVLNAPFLVERDRRQEFEEAAEGEAEERRERMRFRLLGPTPAYSFIDVEQPAWA
jgi:Gas vesicle synthesis protein GvpL/GvpF